MLRCEQLPCCPLSAMMLCLSEGPEQLGQTPWTEVSEAKSQTQPSSFEADCQRYFFTETESRQIQEHTIEVQHPLYPAAAGALHRADSDSRVSSLGFALNGTGANARGRAQCEALLPCLVTLHFLHQLAKVQKENCPRSLGHSWSQRRGTNCPVHVHTDTA